MEDQSLKARTIKGVLWSASERFGSQGIHFILGIIIARLLLPSDYGLIGMLSVFMAVSQTFIDSGFYKALVRKKELSDVDFSTAFYFNIVIGVLCYGLLFVSAPYISSFYHEPRLTILTRVIGLNLIFNSFCVVQRAYFTIRIDFKTQTKITFIASFCSGIAALFLAYISSAFSTSSNVFIPDLCQLSSMPSVYLKSAFWIFNIVRLHASRITLKSMCLMTVENDT